MTLDTPVLGVDALDAVVALCDRSLSRPLSRAELEGALFAPDQPTVLRGDPAIGIVAAVPGQPDGFIRLLARRSRSTAGAVMATRCWLRRSPISPRARSSPSAPTRRTTCSPASSRRRSRCSCLLEKHRYQREDANFNMEVDLSRIPPDPGGTTLATAADRAEVDDWMRVHWANWTAEVLRALDQGTLLLARDENRVITGFCAWNVNRGGLLGPIASRPDLIGKQRRAAAAPRRAAPHRARRAPTRSRSRGSARSGPTRQSAAASRASSSSTESDAK